MKSTRQKQKAPKNGRRPAGAFPARKPVPMATGHRRALQAAAALMMVIGLIILLKVVLTIQSGTAWDDLETSSRDTQPFEFWSFVVTYFLMGSGMIWMGVNAWRTR